MQGARAHMDKIYKWRPCSMKESGVRRVKKEPVHCSGQNAVVSCRNYRRSFKCRGARLAEERRRKKKIQFSTDVDLQL